MKVCKLVLAICAIMVIALPASSQQYVNGYTRSNGTSVQGYYRSTADSTTSNNYSTKGNYNPYTGQAGTRNPYGYSSGSSYARPSYSGGYGYSRRKY